MRAAPHALCDRFNLLARRPGLAELVERGPFVPAARRPENPSQLEREPMSFSENASRHGYRFAQQCPGFFEAL